MSEDTITQRFEEVEKRYGLTIQEDVAERLHITPGHYSRIKNGKTPMKHTRKAIEEAFPDINIDWLETGRGPMLKQQLESFAHEPEPDYLSRNQIAANCLYSILGWANVPPPNKAATKARDYADALLKALSQ